MKKFKLGNNDFLKKNTFVVPNNYFENSFSNILQCTENKSFKLKNSENKLSFNVSESYFEESAIQILENAQKWKKLDEIEVVQNYSIPERYFDLLPMQIQAKITKKRSVLEFDWDAIVPKLAYSGIAALFIFGVYFGINLNTVNNCKDLLCNVSKSEIREYLQNHIEPNHESIYENSKLENLVNQSTVNQKEIMEQIDISQVEYEL